MPYYYAQINENNIVISMSQLTGEVTASNMIPLTEEEYLKDLLGKWYDKTKKAFILIPI
jgi:hypothetical protein